MEIEYIKTKDGQFFYPQKAGVKDESRIVGNYPVCIIKSISNGKFQIDYFDNSNCIDGYCLGDEDKPNTRLILYPNGIEKISYYITRE